MNKKHVLIMVACCLVPIAGFALVAFFNVPLNSVLFFALILFCPLSHLLMMKYMKHGVQPGSGHQQVKMKDHVHHEVIPPISRPGEVIE